MNLDVLHGKLKMNNIHYSSASNEWSTPQDFYDKLNNGITVVPQDHSWINHAMFSHGTCVISNSTMFTEEKYNYFMQNGYEKEIKPKKIIQIPKLLQNLYEKTIK